LGRTSASIDIRAWWTGASKKSVRVIRAFASISSNLKSVYTVWDNQTGAIDAETFRFPYPDAAFDAVLLASVFTHMPPGETRQYLRELARVMRPRAKALLSIFLSPSGAVDVRDEGINVFHDLAEFLADIGALSLRARLTGLRFVPGMQAGASVQPDPAPAQSFDYEHNWYVLSRSLVPCPPSARRL
jgi:SAM-dependent methyltransferase